MEISAPSGLELGKSSAPSAPCGHSMGQLRGPLGTQLSGWLECCASHAELAVLRVLGIATEVALDGFVALEQVGGLDLHRLRPAATRHDAHRSSRLPAAHLDPRLVAVAARLTLPLRDGGAHLGQAPCALQQLGG